MSKIERWRSSISNFWNLADEDYIIVQNILINGPEILDDAEILKPKLLLQRFSDEEWKNNAENFERGKEFEDVMTRRRRLMKK